jgi:homoserine O-succinyltransferase/O-acetyltransferase
MLTADQRSSPIRSGHSQQVVIGLVNNMPDGALHSTERQFGGLLDAASRHVPTYLRYFYLPGLPRGPQAQGYISQRYEDVSQLQPSELDGLIVTGTEPRSAVLQDEPYWPALRDLIDQVEDDAIPTIWSCLAAHAAVLHMDGIHRRRLRDKLCGVFDCTRVVDHKILANRPARWCVPHSRQNGLPEEDLISKGYLILSSSAEVGVDTFVREHSTLSIFLQGHPEYDPEALFLEYRRDVRRFLAGERASYPAMPSGYFDADTASSLLAFQEQAMRQRSMDVLPQFPENPGSLVWAWRGLAVSLYANWLSYILRRHKRRSLTQAMV